MTAVDLDETPAPILSTLRVHADNPRYFTDDSGTAVYQPDPGPFSIQLEAGQYRYEWFDPATGQVTGSEKLDWSGGLREFTSDRDGAMVFYVVSDENSNNSRP
ncbi:hypothetical protein [Novipirellula artificiosorum]|uniref:Uncharacterized protein n=1 Tax=Novipirellula artificiosorum TaxID=2528016 RepID=A0A5C6D4J0_9BACT|nr:hypothetical protein [Novipirellula artificiosorum]TWU31822.1 hypothetical protein Poly41_60570 [Novipirellula artificiosorum]